MASYKGTLDGHTEDPSCCVEHATLDDVSVWEWSGSAYDEGAEAAEWLSTYFGKPCRLVCFKEESEIRPTNPEYAQGCSPSRIASRS